MNTRWPLNRSLLSTMCTLLVVAGCGGSSTHFNSRWAAQNAPSVSTNTARIATVFFTENESMRRVGEDVMVRELTRIGATAFPSYTVTTVDPRDREQSRRKLEDAGIDVVISMRVVSWERTVDYGPSYWSGTPYYGSLWGYWGHGWNAVYNPIAYSGSVVGMETLLYSVKDDRLLWAGMSETFNKETVKSAVKSIARKAVDKMDDDNVLVAN
jgi:hypothetical protein